MTKTRTPPAHSQSRSSLFERGKLEVQNADFDQLRETIDVLVLKAAPPEIESAIKLEGRKHNLGLLRAYAVLTLELKPDEFINCVAAQYADPAERFMLAYAITQRFQVLLTALRGGKTWVSIIWFENGLGVTAGNAPHAN